MKTGVSLGLIAIGAILAFAVKFKVVVIHQVSEFRMTHCTFSHDCRDKDNAVGLGED